jgi:hypothetical protein
LIADKIRAAFIAVAAACLFLSGAQADDDEFPSLPLPPDIGGLIGLLPTYSKGRIAHVSLVRHEAERQGLPADVADAVAHIESSYDPQAVGVVGEVGLMQIRPQTAAMLGYKGLVAGLFDPETNVRYSVTYLAGAWRLANGDLCRTLMKYRAGHGEVRMTPLSVEYCRRARNYLAAIGSPLGQGAAVDAAPPPGRFGAEGAVPTRETGPKHLRSASRRSLGGPIRLASTEVLPLTPSQVEGLADRRALRRVRKLQGAAFWAAHEARIKVITAKVRASQLRIATGI